MPEPVAVLRGVGRSFGEREVLAGVDLTVSEGEVLGLFGPNGGGKSTLLLMMAGLLRPTAGSITVCGIEARALSLTSAGQVGLVTARPGLYPLLTGWENLRHFGGLFGLDGQTVQHKAGPLLEVLKLSTGLDDRVGRWSTGMQQKLSLVRALLLSPKLLLLDEPTANLDPVVARVLYGEVRRRADDGLACALVSHDLHALESVCDRAALIAGGVEAELTCSGDQQVADGPLMSAWRREVGS